MLLQRLGVQLQSQLPSTSTSEDFYQPSSDNLEAKQIVTVRRFLSSLLWITQQLMSSQVWTSRDTHRFRYGLWSPSHTERSLVSVPVLECICRMLKIPVTAITL